MVVWLSGREDVDIRGCFTRVVEWVGLLRVDGGWEACFGVWYQTMYYIGEIDIEFRRREKSKILAVYVEE